MDKSQARLYVLKSSDDTGIDKAGDSLDDASTILQVLKIVLMRAINHDLLPAFFWLALGCGLLASLPAPAGTGSTPPISATQFASEIIRAPAILHAPLTPPTHLSPVIFRSSRGARALAAG